MKAIGFLNRFPFFPAPVVLVVLIADEHHFIFPTGTMWPMSGDEKQQQLQRTHNYHALPSPVTFMAGQVGFAFARTDLYIGTRAEVEVEIRSKLNGNKIDEAERYWLARFMKEDIRS